MEDVNGLLELRQIHHPKLTLCTDANLSYAKANGRHRFPVIGIDAALDLVELMASEAPGSSGKSRIRSRLSPHQTISFIVRGLSQF
jgi:hypothetical protein